MRISLPRMGVLTRQPPIIKEVKELASFTYPPLDRRFLRCYYVLSEEDMAYIKLKYPQWADTVLICHEGSVISNNVLNNIDNQA